MIVGLEAGAPYFRLQVPKMIALRDAPARLTSVLRHAGVDVELQPDEAVAGRQDVPVVLPMRESPPGGPYGTAEERHLLCRAVFSVGVSLTG